MKNIRVVLKIACFLTLSLLLSGCSQSSNSYYYDDYENYETTEDDVITSDNWECTDDCGGHEAGYEWASENDITDPYDCDGNSNSFTEGCEAYANEYTEENEEDYEEDYDYSW